MARLPDGSWLVAFERHHRLWRYPTLTATPMPVDGPADIGRQPGNGGIEALTALADGRIIAISEEYSLRPGTVVGWIGQPAPGRPLRSGARSVRQDPRLQSDGDRPAARRLVRHARARLRHGARRALPRHALRGRPARSPAARCSAEELARLASPYAVDNLEGMAATRGPRGETLLWLISDDNFNPLQRNILLLFELAK